MERKKETTQENTKQKRNKLKIRNKKETNWKYETKKKQIENTKKKKNVLTFGNRTWINRTVVYYIYHCTIHTIMLNEELNYMINPISQ